MSKRLALLIGNVRYQDGRLSAPVPGRELTALADVLRDPQFGQFDDVFVQVNNAAVAAQLAIAEFFEESSSPHDTLLIYFAGHILYHQNQPYLAQWDTFTEEYLEATTVQPEYLRRRLALAPARQKLLILDGCISNLLADGPPLPEDDDWLVEAFKGADFVTFTAVRPVSPDDEQPIASHFTPALVNGLRQGLVPVNDDGQVTAAAWFAYAQSQANTAGQHCSLTNEAGAETVIVAAIPEKLRAVPPAVPVPDTAVSEEPAGRKKWLVLSLLTLLLLIVLGGGLYGAGFLEPTAGAEPTATTASAIVQAETEEPTATPTTMPTSTAVPSDTPTPTETPVPTKPAVKVSSTATSLITPSSQTPTASTSQPSDASTPLPGVHIVRQRVFMRSGPAINFRITEYLDQGTVVTVLGQTPSGAWYNVALEDGRTGWVYSEMVESSEESPEEIPEVATIPSPVNEFYDFSAGETDEGLTIAVSHVYVGTVGPNATFRAELLPETNLIAAEYETENELGLGQFIVNFSRVGEGAYTSTAVRLCMVSPAGEAFYCDTFPVRKEW
jgi:hypothetical protein